MQRGFGWLSWCQVPQAFISGAMASAVGRRALSHCHGLGTSTVRQLALAHDSSMSTYYLTSCLGSASVDSLWAPVARLLGDSGRLTGWYQRATVDDRLACCLMDGGGRAPQLLSAARTAGSPWLAAACLRSRDLSVAAKLSVAGNAFLAERLAWLAGLGPGELSDSEAWDCVSMEDVVDENLAGSASGKQLRTDSLPLASQLLYLRPSLRNAALGSGRPLWLMAAAVVPLSPSEQLRLVEAENAVDKEELRAFLVGNLDRFWPMAVCNFGPVGVAASLPWACHGLLDNVRLHGSHGAVIVDGCLTATAPLPGYPPTIVRDLRRWTGPTLIADCPSWAAQEWLYAALWAPYMTYVQIELAKRGDLNRKGRRDLDLALSRRRPAEVGAVLARLGRYAGVACMPEPTIFAERRPSSVPSAGPVPPVVADVVSALAQCGSHAELEIALSLLEDSSGEFERDATTAVLAARALCA